jgi:hypothetical protein
MPPNPAETPSSKSRENEFIKEFISALQFKASGCVIETHKSLLYDVTVDGDGRIRLGVDYETGDPKRGGGKGFQQDILICEDRALRQEHVVPRVVIEVKFQSVTTHDTIVYSEKARRVRNIYPYVRYGLLLGGLKTIPGRVLRLGQNFDFILAVSHPLVPEEVGSARELFSEDLGRIAFGKERISIYRKKMMVSRRVV